MKLKYLPLILGVIGLLLSRTTASDAEIQEDTILGIWLFDDGNKNITDASGNGHDGQVFGNPKIVDGPFGKALFFNGGADKIEIPHDDTFVTPTFTIMAWVNVADQAGGWRMIVGKDAWPDRNYAMFVHQNNGSLHCAFGSPAQQDVGNFNSQSLITDGEWHHVAFTYDLKVGRAYIDGEVDNAKATNAKPGTPQIAVIISRPPFKGSIDEVLIANVAFEPEDVKIIAEKGIAETLKIVRAIDANGKLATTWATIKKSQGSLDKIH